MNRNISRFSADVDSLFFLPVPPPHSIRCIFFADCRYSRCLANGSAGFTLVEIIVALAVLIIILALFSQIVGNIESVTTAGRQRLDADSTAQLALDRIAHDLAARSCRSDVDWMVQKKGGDDALYFFSESPGFSSGSTTSDTLALVGYRAGIDAQGHKVLERVGRTMSLDSDNQFHHLPERLDDNDILSAPADSVQVLVNGLIRFELEFLLTDGTIVESVPSRYASGKDGLHYLNQEGKTAVMPAANLSDLESVRAIIVTIALIDDEKMRILTDGQINAIVTHLPDAGNLAAGADRGESGPGVWQKVIEGGAIQAPQAALSSIRIYRKSISLHD